MLRRSIGTFPVVILTGSRQSGKSTLCREILGDTHSYVSLEDPDVRRQALDDPRTFLINHPAPVILDEIQYAPELPSYIQGIVDGNRARGGQYVLTGSQNFLMMQQVSQSLAGRAALLTLHPCSVREVDAAGSARAEPAQIADWILRGGYPELRAHPEIDRGTWCGSYIRLYLERDARNILSVGDLGSFERFIRLSAIRTGQMLNKADLARDAGVSVPTVSRWLSVLEASYQVFLLRPFHANLSKRLVKTPKLYFGDTALASYLMGIHDARVLLGSPQLGPLFETAVVLEHVKLASFGGDLPSFSYLRTKDGLEVDLVIEDGVALHAREITMQRTLSSRMGDSLVRSETLLGRPLRKTVLLPVERRQSLGRGVTLVPWSHVAWTDKP